MGVAQRSGPHESDLETVLNAHFKEDDGTMELHMAKEINFGKFKVKLETDGSEIVLNRMGGSKREFEDLCEFVCEELGITTD